MRGNVNQIGFENLHVFKHQALWRPLWFTVDVYPVSLAVHLSCLFKVGRKEAMEEINQQRYFMLAPVSTKRMVRHHSGSCLQSLPVNLRSLSYCKHGDLSKPWWPKAEWLSRQQPCQMTLVASAVLILGSRTAATQLSYNTAPHRKWMSMMQG